MSYNPLNQNGQATSANSSPVVVASDQSAVPVSGSVTIGANSSVNVNQVAGTAVDVNSGAKSAGTQRVVIATDQPQLTNALKVDGSATTQPVSGTVTVQQSTAANLKVDLSGTAANATAIKVDGSAVTQPVSGTVTSNIGTTNGLALDASVTGLQVNQGSTTSGQKGELAQGAVTTSAPTYTTAQTSPLSLTTAGALRTDASATTQPVSGTVTANIAANSSVNVNQVGGTAVDTNSGNKSAGTQRMVIATDQPNLTTPLNVNNAQVNGVTVSTDNGASGTGVQRVTIANNSTGQVALAAGSASVGTVGLNTGTNAVGSVNLAPTTGGWSVSSQTNLTTTATVSSAAGKFGGYMFINLNGAPAYIQVFDTTGAVTLGTTTPTFVIPIPSNTTAANGAGANLEMANGIAITNGIKIAATTTATGATTVGTGLSGFVMYK